MIEWCELFGSYCCRTLGYFLLQGDIRCASDGRISIVCMCRLHWNSITESWTCRVKLVSFGGPSTRTKHATNQSLRHIWAQYELLTVRQANKGSANISFSSGDISGVLLIHLGVSPHLCGIYCENAKLLLSKILEGVSHSTSTTFNTSGEDFCRDENLRPIVILTHNWKATLRGCCRLR
jgi:hypothetical protein